MSGKFLLSHADYIVVILMFLISTSIGLYYYFRVGRKQITNEEYLLAGKKMSLLPVSFSLMASFLSAPNLLGLPTEMYLFGTNMTFMSLGFLLGPIIASFLFLPIYFKTGISTTFEYLEKRFGRHTRRLLSLMYLLQEILFNGVSLYAPALALSAVTSLSVWTSILSLGITCTFYCIVGGIKAIILTDVFQAILMYACLLTIIIKGCLDLGGISAIFKRAYDGGRILIPTFQVDFSTRYTIYSIFLQGLIITTASYTVSQTQVQRQLTLETLKRSKIATLLSIPLLVSFQLLCCFSGLIFYVYFQSCDPVSSPEHPIESYDQIMPYYITSTLGEYPGLPGLCIAGIFSASLSTISSAVNSMAAVTYGDIIRPMLPHHTNPVLITKIASLFFGALSIFITSIIASMGNLIKSSILVVGMISGPSLAVFILAAFTTTANQTGVNIGVLTGIAFAGFMTFFLNERHYTILPLEKNCSENFTLWSNFSLPRKDISTTMNLTLFSMTEESPVDDLFQKYPLSFMWIAPLSLLICLITGYFGSWIISYIQGNTEIVKPELLSPIRQRFCSVENDSTTEKFLKPTADTSC